MIAARKSLSMALVTVFSLVTILAGCSSDKGNNENAASPSPTTTPAATEGGDKTDPPANEPLTFSFYVNYDWYSPKGLESDAKPLNTWLRNEKKVTIKEISANGNAAQKLGTMIASGELPDVIQMDRDTNFDKLVAEGKIVAIDEYLNNPKYPNLKKLASEKTLNLLRAKDGKLYGIPNWFGRAEDPKTSNAGWVVNKKIYKELGSPKLDTFDDMYNYLVQVKQKYPDIVPLDTANTDEGTIQVHNFIYAGMGEMRTVDMGKSAGMFALANFDKTEFTSIFQDPAYLESYQFTSKLFREKLLSQDTFSQKREQFQEKLNNGKIAVAATYDITGGADVANQKLQAADPDAGYTFIPYPVKSGVDVNKISPTASGSMGWNFNSITTSAKNPEQIFAFFDWLLSPEGTTAAQFGPPGLYWTPDDKGFPIFNDKYKNATKEQKDNDGIGSFYFNLQGSPVWGDLDKDVMAKEGTPKTWNTEANEFYGKYVKIDGDQFNQVKNFPKSSPEDMANQQIKLIMEKAAAKMVFAKNDAEVEKAMKDAEKQVSAAGYDKLLAYMNKVWQANVAQMNSK
ncbi:extracellular solute-binding protein [Paenibacillus sp. GCM10023252]|uniref:extracellular solute-binding protein n=1 Tax=Paenibacillus sp. GCM10023252 TaxID=3252649 RepID=UPI00362352E7